jgi:dihydrofolate reductase
MLSMIAAMAHQRVIGNNNQMPWHMPADFAWFRKNTMGKPIVMGRNTWESIGKALPGRRNIILSRTSNNAYEGADQLGSIEEVLIVSQQVDELMIIGGAQIYQQFLPKADRLYLTFIDAAIEGDTFFPDYEEYAWKEVYRENYLADGKNPYDCAFVILDKSS